MDESSIALEATVMAIREHVMGYYKNTCVTKFVKANVGIYPTGQVTGRREERREYELQHPCLIVIGDVPIAKIQSVPDRVILYDEALLRSPVLRKVKEGFESFMGNYLRGVKVESTDDSPDWIYDKSSESVRKDKELILANLPKYNQMPAEGSLESLMRRMNDDLINNEPFGAYTQILAPRMTRMTTFITGSPSTWDVDD